MIYYEMKATVESLPWNMNEEGTGPRRRTRYGIFIAAANEHYYYEHKNESCIFVYAVNEEEIFLNGIFRDNTRVQELFFEQLRYMNVEVSEPLLKEITFERVNRHLEVARNTSYILSGSDINDILDEFGLRELNNRLLDFDEFIIKDQTREEIVGICSQHPFGEEFLSEIDRIYSTPIPEKVFGHPAHYLVQCDDQDMVGKMGEAMLSGLYANGRLKNRRYAYMEVPEYTVIPSKPFERLYQSLEGGAIIIDYGKAEIDEDQTASSKREGIAVICQMIRKYRNQVLTMLCLPRESTQIKELFYQYLGNQCMICFSEHVLSPERSRNYLKQLAEKKGMEADDDLLTMVKEDQKYYASDLTSLCEAWFDKKLKNDVFTSYTEEPLIEMQERAKENTFESCAYDELNAMIGLEKAKKVINKALDYAKAQKLFASRGMKEERFSMHMVFTGNPGTAKTTVARLFARIMKENGILTKGTFLEVGRADLVGKFVGWTAQIIQEKFKKARGGVLFIDEAYSLVDDRPGSYGDEAINTIVQEMENHRKDVIVIFAGYPDKMEEFIHRNPGLRSRIAFQVPFDDYNADELCQIADLMVKEKELHFSPEAREKLHTSFERVSGQNDFGNGRYVRNLVEQARMAQASRLVHTSDELVTDELIHTITEEDIETPAFTPKLQIKSSRIGYRV